MKKRQTQTHIKRLGLGGLRSLMEKPHHPEVQSAYSIELNSESGLLHFAEQAGGVTTYR